MAISGVGLGMAATGVFVAYVAITDQPPLDALRELFKGRVTAIPNSKPSLAGLPTSDRPSDSQGGSGPSDSGLAGAAVRYLGRQYQWAHNFDPPNGGGDCSGLVYRAFHDMGFLTPRLSSWQYPTWKVVRKNAGEVQAGDVLWYPGHVAIAVGNGNMVEAPTVGVPVRIAPIRRGYLALTPQAAVLATYAAATSRGRAA